MCILNVSDGSLQMHKRFYFHLLLEDGRMVLTTAKHTMCICSDLNRLDESIFYETFVEIVSVSELGDGKLVSFTRKAEGKKCSNYIICAFGT